MKLSIYKSIFQKPMIYIYILRLQNNKYYVGKTKYPNFRLEQHFNSTASTWTTKYKPIEVVDIIKGDAFDEDKYTKIYMAKYGILNVRGGSYCTVELTRDIIEATIIGTEKLSSKLIGRTSTKVPKINAINEKVRLISGYKIRTIIKPVIKKAKLPSRVLLKIFVLPYFLPTIAAAVSE